MKERERTKKRNKKPMRSRNEQQRGKNESDVKRRSLS